MRFLFFYKYPLIFCAIILSIASCRNEIDCTTTATNLVKLSFFDSTNNVQSLEFDSVFALRLEDSILFDTTGVADTIFSLPLNPFQFQTAFVFIRTTIDEMDTSQLFDTIEFSYSVQQLVITEECGAVQVYRDLDTLFHTFDSVFIDQPSLSTLDARNVRIFN